MTGMPIVFDDGGRADAGYKGRTGDCVVRAIAIAAQLPYQQVYEAINVHAQSERPRNGSKRSSAREGVHKQTTRRYLEALGWKWHPTMQIGSGCQVHMVAEELPEGRLIVALSRHLTAVIDHVIYDTFDPSREGNRCVYGYFTAPTPWRRRGKAITA